MEFKDKIKEIKEALLKGGLVISNRNTGKTAALAEILVEDPTAIVVTGNYHQKDQLARLLLYKYGWTTKDLEFRILISSTAEQRLLGLHQDFSQHIYIDEYFNNEYGGPYWAAVGSLPKNTTIIKD